MRFFLFTERGEHKVIKLGQQVSFHVPIRGEGRGSVLIGNDNIFGFLPGPRLGTGEILIQARGFESRIEIGDGNRFSNNVSIIANERISIGNRCLVGDLVTIFDSDFHEIDPATRMESCGQTKPITIGNNVWLGSRVMVLKGVTIGDNSVVAAASVVTRSIPANCLAAGAPANVLRSIGDAEGKSYRN